MKVVLYSCCLVQPAEPTWNGRMPLSEFDQINGVTHVQTIYFYKPEKNLQITPNYKDTTCLFTTLKTSLSRVLVHFYPLAGRLTNCVDHDGGATRMELDCNGKGAQLIEASCDDAKLDDFGDFTTPSPDFHYLLPQINYTSSIEEIPILSVQLTKFSCGGYTLGTSISHTVVDGFGVSHFLSEWARLARGEPFGTAPPFLDRRVLRAGESYIYPPDPHHVAQLGPPLPLLIGESSASENESIKETEITMLKLSRLQVEMLKIQANNYNYRSSRRAYTRYESIAGHIWRSACKARGHAHDEQPTAMGTCVDIRRHVQPPLPENYFGNAIIDVIATGLSGELVTRPLGYAVGKIREAIDSVTSEYVNSTIDFLKNPKELSRLLDILASRDNQGPFFGNPNIEVISWMNLSLYGLDFGWGKEIFMAPAATHDCDGDSLILRGYHGEGSVMVSLCLQAAVMEDFKKFFYQDIIIQISKL